MLKKTVTYTDYNDVECTEDCYFNLTKSELVEMQASTDGGFDAMLRKIVDEKNVSEIMRIFKELMIKSYGVKSEDGKSFKKNDELREAFVNSPVFDEIFMELVQDPEKASEFIKGIIPSALAKQIDAQN